MGAKEEDGELDVGWLHSTVWDFINLPEGRVKQLQVIFIATNDKNPVKTFTVPRVCASSPSMELLGGCLHMHLSCEAGLVVTQWCIR